MNTLKINNTISKCICGIGLAFALCINTGCQISVGGQTLPSPYYQSDDIQYYPAGPEMKLSREAAALEAAKAERSRLGR